MWLKANNRTATTVGYIQEMSSPYYYAAFQNRKHFQHDEIQNQRQYLVSYSNTLIISIYRPALFPIQKKERQALR